jgi:hypothetical protein
MKYVLILKTGKVMVFGVEECAKLYKDIYGGTLVSTFNTKANIERIKESVTC